MSRFVPKVEDFAERVRASFARQNVMATIGASLVRAEPGEAEIAMPVAAQLCQQHGFIHAGIVTTLADTACGYAAFSLMPASAGVLTAEFKVNLLAPAAGERLVAIGRVVKPGRTLTVAQGEVFAEAKGEPGSSP